MVKLLNINKYFLYYKFKSLLFRNFVLISIIVIIPFFAISAAFVFYSSTLSLNKIIEINNVQIIKTQDSMDTKLKEMNIIASKMTLDKNVNNFLLFPSDTNREEEIIKTFKYITTTYNYIDSVYIFSEKNDSIIYTNGTNCNKTHFKKIYDNINQEKYFFMHIDNNQYFTNYLTLVKPIYLSDSHKIGAIFLNISIYHFNELLNTDDTENTTYIIDNNGKILCGNDFIGENYTSDTILSKFDLTKTANHEIHSSSRSSYIISEQPSKINNIDYLSVTKLENGVFNLNIYMILLMLFLCLLTDFIVSWIVTIKTYRPIYDILNVLDDNYEIKTKNKTVNVKTANEIQYIIKSLREIQDDNLSFKNKLNTTINELNQTHYNLMQAQINSHFLGNTLQSINWLAYDLTGSPNKVTESLTQLSELYRLITYTNVFLIPLDEEFKYTKNYIALLELKFDNTFTIEYNIDKNVLNYKIPKLCMQPIIENTITHGFADDSTDKKNVITIDAFFNQNNDVEIVISDNGCGMDNSELAELRASLVTDQGVKSSIGLSNIDCRLKIIFGNNYGLFIESEPEKGTNIHIYIPKKL